MQEKHQLQHSRAKKSWCKNSTVGHEIQRQNGGKKYELKNQVLYTKHSEFIREMAYLDYLCTHSAPVDYALFSL